ncbi:MAG TPA: RIP metalloprotease [Armatimonadota bacterium]|nr:RIP metalloprotease [Armatimonadota bacterium]
MSPLSHFFAGISLSSALHDAKTTVITLLAFAVVFGILAFCHEFGHFLTAKMLGMSVDQFGIGFPPTYGWTLFRRSGTSYTLHPIPLGAFVRIQGMDPNDPDTPNSFMRRPPWARLIVLSAGSAGNLMLAALVFLLMGVTTGIPARDYPTNNVDNVGAGTPAAAAGLKAGDIVLAVRRADQPGAWVRPKPLGKHMDASALVQLIHQSFTPETIRGKPSGVGKYLIVQVQHKNGKLEILRARPAVHVGTDGKLFAALGYSPGAATDYQRLNAIQAVSGGFDTTWLNALDLVQLLASRIKQVFSQEISASEFGQSFGGPVTIARASGQFAQTDFAHFLQFLGILSINLAVINLLPLPVFDGGNIIIVLLEIVRRKQLEPAKMMIVQFAGIIMIACIFLYITYNDVLRWAHHSPMP